MEVFVMLPWGWPHSIKPWTVEIPRSYTDSYWYVLYPKAYHKGLQCPSAGIQDHCLTIKKRWKEIPPKIHPRKAGKSWVVRTWDLVMSSSLLPFPLHTISQSLLLVVIVFEQLFVILKLNCFLLQEYLCSTRNNVTGYLGLLHPSPSGA